MNDAELAAVERTTSDRSERLRRTEEFRTWFFLTVVMAPLLAVLTVAGYGFFVWMYQLFVGPPGA